MMLTQTKPDRIVKDNAGDIARFARMAGGKSSPVVYRPRISLILISTLLGIVLGLLLVGSLHAMPPHPDLLARIRAGLQPMPAPLAHRSALLDMGIDAPGDLLTKRLGGRGKAGVSGSINILAILIDFSDQNNQVAAIAFDTLIYVNTPGTVRNYYQEVSYGMLTITTVNLPSTLGWTRAPDTLAYYAYGQYGLYGAYPHNAQKLVEDAVDAADLYVNFAQYDNNGDGDVDGLIVVHAGVGAEFSGNANDIWSHKWSINPRTKDGVSITTYSMEPEYWITPGDMTCGVYCHELGHVFGLPDLYDTDYSSEGIGDWSLMAGGSWNGTLGDSPAHPDAWCKVQLGFVAPAVLSTDQSAASIPAVESNQTIYKLWTNGSPGNEYFLVENRQQTGYDTYLPAAGLMIWHIDDNVANNDNEWWPGCGWGSHYWVALVQADNLWELEDSSYHNRGDAGDVFPGTSSNRTFDGSSGPNSDSYAGAATNVAVSNISNSSTNMSADLAIGMPQDIEGRLRPLPDVVDLYQNYPNPFNSATNIGFNVRQAANIEVSVFDIAGRLVRGFGARRYEPGTYVLEWDGTSDDGQAAGSGVYVARLMVDHNSLYRKMLYLK